MIFSAYIETPIGLVEVLASNEVILSVLFVDKAKQENTNNLTDIAVLQLGEYFNGDRQQFDLPLSFQGTEFQNNVWQALLDVGYGKTSSYKSIAEKIENPRAVRAVGAANGKNPLTIVVPCHRIIGANGSLTGYAFGTNKKAWLLDHESKHSQSII